MPRDDVERARNVRNALANASVSERKRRGNGFPLPPLASTLPIHPRKPSSLRLTHPFGPLAAHPPLCPFAQRLSLWSVSSHFLAIPSGNYYKSESQSIFNPRGMVFGSNGEAGGRTGDCTFSGDRRGAAGADATMPVMR